MSVVTVIKKIVSLVDSIIIDIKGKREEAGQALGFGEFGASEELDIEYGTSTDGIVI